MNRPLISYSDLPDQPRNASPSTWADGARQSAPNHWQTLKPGKASSGNKQGPALGKRKRDRKFRESANNVHWDAQGSMTEGSVQVKYDDENAADNSCVEYSHDASKTRTGITKAANSSSAQLARNSKRPKVQSTSQQEERIAVALDGSWDDSALIEAWDAAMEEYKMLNGDKDWKTEPVHKNSIWYTASDKVAEVGVTEEEEEWQDGGEEDGDLADENDTAAELGETTDADDVQSSSFANLPSTVEMSTEEIFRKAVEASYWAGYWAGAYNNTIGRGKR